LLKPRQQHLIKLRVRPHIPSVKLGSVEVTLVRPQRDLLCELLSFLLQRCRPLVELLLALLVIVDRLLCRVQTLLVLLDFVPMLASLRAFCASAWYTLASL
jgi:hypothetical protein